MNKEGHVLNAVLLGVGLGFVLEPSGTVDTLLTVVAVTVPVTLGALFPDGSRTNPRPTPSSTALRTCPSLFIGRANERPR